MLLSCLSLLTWGVQYYQSHLVIHCRSSQPPKTTIQRLSFKDVHSLIRIQLISSNIIQPSSFQLSYQLSFNYHPYISCGQNKFIDHPPVITIFIGGMFTIPSHGWSMTLFYHQDIHPLTLDQPFFGKTIIDHYICIPRK